MLSVQACNRHPVGSLGLSKVHTRRSQTVPSMIFTHLTMCVHVCVCLCECMLRVVTRREGSANVKLCDPVCVCVCVCARISSVFASRLFLTRVSR